MPWFKVDDSFHAHPKVLATDPAALGLWVVAGAWSSAHLTEGRVPDQVLPRLLPDSETLARTLVTAGLWRKVRGGYQFHDWTDYNPTAKEVREQRERRVEAGRKGGLNSAKARSKRQANASARASPTVQPPTRPFPSTKERGSARPLRGAARAAPNPNPAHCPRHQGQPAHNCALCRSEALAAEEIP